LVQILLLSTTGQNDKETRYHQLSIMPGSQTYFKILMRLSVLPYLLWVKASSLLQCYPAKPSLSRLVF